MESEISGSDHTLAQTFGLLAGLALAALLTKLSLSALSPLNSSYVGISLLFAAIGLGVPLFIISLGITMYLAGKSAMGPLLAMGMWLPVLASLAILLVSESLRGKEKAAYALAHPNVREVHVNLTGRDLTFDPMIGSYPAMKGDGPADFLEVRRDPVSNRGDEMAAYRGVLPAPDFKSMAVIYGPSEQGEAASVPVVVTATPASWAPFLPELGTSLATRLVHFYYHYPAGVEVASAIDWDDGSRSEQDNGQPASGVYIHNLTSETIVRLEVNGDTVPFYSGVAPLRAGNCSVEHSTAVLGTDLQLKVRWQTAQSAPIWKQATPTVPSFRNPIPAGRRVTSTTVHLFFQPGDGVTVQRARTTTTPDFYGRVHTSEPLPSFKTPPTCGDAAYQYPPTLARSRD